MTLYQISTHVSVDWFLISSAPHLLYLIFKCWSTLCSLHTFIHTQGCNNTYHTVLSNFLLSKSSFSPTLNALQARRPWQSHQSKYWLIMNSLIETEQIDVCRSRGQGEVGEVNEDGIRCKLPVVKWITYGDVIYIYGNYPVQDPIQKIHAGSLIPSGWN